MSRLTAGMKRRIKRQLSEEKPTLWIGKSKASEHVVKEIGNQLEKKEMVKVRILKSALQEDKAAALAAMIAGQTGATLIEVRGHTFVLYKRREKRAVKEGRVAKRSRKRN